MAPMRQAMAFSTFVLSSLVFAPLASSIDLQMPAFDVGGDSLLKPLDASLELGKAAMQDIAPDLQVIQGGAEEQQPQMHRHEKRYGSGQPFWFEQIKRQGKIAYGNSSYVLWRNVKDYGAKGDGITDDTDAINNATADGDRCGLGCKSTTVTPAIIYFPAGTYRVSSPLIQWYYTQFVGDANDLPVMKALPNFYGIGVFDSNVYLPYGYNWYQNQNNFWRQIRNFVIDITEVPPQRPVHCIHWQVAQATSLQNIVMNMVEGVLGDNNQQQGIFMDNGSGGWIEDLIFNGGQVGFFAGNQQFTVRNLTFNYCETAIFQNWDWVFNYKNMHINNCGVGLDMTQGGLVPATASIIVQDSVFSNVQFPIITTFDRNSTPVAAATLILDNVNFINADPAVQYPNGTQILAGNRLIPSFIQGTAYTAYDHPEQVGNKTCWQPTVDYARVQQPAAAPPIPDSLKDANGHILERSRPQWEGRPVSDFISIIDYGCIGDGLTDDTNCLQSFLNSIRQDQIAYVDHGAYLISDTIIIPKDIKIQGEVWSLIMVDGSSPVFSNEFTPTPAIRVGDPGDIGTTEIIEIVFETRGPAIGAIMMEWNLACVEPGMCGLFDTHWRIGGSAGTLLQSDRCTKKPNIAHEANSTCWCAHTLLHVTTTASLYMANNWGWVADHELDLPDENQIDIYNGRGLLVESQGPVWVYGGSFEHSMLYNYNIANAKDIYLSVIQSETAYMQNNPNSLSSFQPSERYSDPNFSECYQATCYKTFAVHITNSTYIFIYGAGLYSFFNNYDQGCLLTESCQILMVALEKSEAIYMYGLSTKAAVNMVEVDGVALVPQAANKNTFCQTCAVFEYP